MKVPPLSEIPSPPGPPVKNINNSEISGLHLRPVSQLTSAQGISSDIWLLARSGCSAAMQYVGL
jgi:hypothetical protein